MKPATSLRFKLERRLLLSSSASTRCLFKKFLACVLPRSSTEASTSLPTVTCKEDLPRLRLQILCRRNPKYGIKSVQETKKMQVLPKHLKPATSMSTSTTSTSKDDLKDLIQTLLQLHKQLHTSHLLPHHKLLPAALLRDFKLNQLKYLTTNQSHRRRDLRRV